MDVGGRNERRKNLCSVTQLKTLSLLDVGRDLKTLRMEIMIDHEKISYGAKNNRKSEEGDL
jgi:hypothetical protein